MPWWHWVCCVAMAAFVVATAALVANGLRHSLPMRLGLREPRRRSELPVVPIHHRDVLRRAKTGDLLLFSGYSGDSMIVRAWSWAPLTHVGVVVRESNESGPAWLWEANLDETKVDCLRGCSRGKEGGAQLTDLETSLRAYDGRVFWRPLGRALPLERILPTIAACRDFEFNVNSVDLMRSCVRRNPFARGAVRIADALRVRKDSERTFCSELAATTLLAAGAFRTDDIVDPQRFAASVHPQDFGAPSDAPFPPWQPEYRPTDELLWVVPAEGC